MTFPSVKFVLFLTILVSLFFSCQKAEDKSYRWDDDTKEETVVPAWFTQDSVQKLARHLDSVFTKYKMKRGFNGTILVTKYDQVVYKKAFGLADFYKRDSNTVETAFQLASVSKQFTAVAIMMLKDQGKLQYEDSVQQYIPEFPYHGITIRQLLTHQSGLSNYTYFADKLWPDRKQNLTNQDVVNLMVTHQPKPYYKPNTRFDYSNTGYSLLATIVEKVSGVPFATFLRKQIFEPLEMKHTFTYSPDVATLTGPIATGHTRNRQKRTTDYLDTVLGDKGIFSTVDDLYKWDQALYTQKLVKRETLQEAFTGSRPSKKNEEDYGFGWRIKPLPNGDTAVYHGGLWHGFSTYFLRNPKDHSALIVLSNLPNGSLNYLEEIRQVLYPASDSAAKSSKQRIARR
ncbi:serine hydrolase domain-containing protein [Rufibacter quisquiliarum]|uniref:CubicO group peptidase (Beta-lactamase class C family) n=1 Tax=Rufibacter quisquiliarum TaxID=1549639 RepID=A0A839GPU0_9BACT|nr:serine hydrolase domain-containing protein [Rufibacter quisquiliarum]MBA9077545.1 CubicO group peptidase (beta-lactamase class C family) [Rufibacter quisquiliarum]